MVTAQNSIFCHIADSLIIYVSTSFGSFYPHTALFHNVS